MRASRRWLSRIVLAVGLAACGGNSAGDDNGSGSDNGGGGGACDFTQNANACRQCIATSCATEYDACYGDGFHTGAPASGPCGPFGLCLQACGCLESCFQSCANTNDATCFACTQGALSTCIQDRCASACAA